MIAGSATTEGTARYRDRFRALSEVGFYRQLSHVPGASDRWLSSIGLGTYLGEPEESADAEYVAAISVAIASGINVLDTAINYRHQRSERNIGAALAQAADKGVVQRDEVMVCTKAGYLSFDGNLPPDPRGYFLREYIESGVVDPQELVGGMHSIAPDYLRNQIERSRRNLGLETIDVFYLHNPETQLAEVSRDIFYDRLRHAFALLETLVKNHKLRFYGMATWNAFRVPDGARDFISLSEVVSIARNVGGDDHHFRFIQMPFNLAMPEAFVLSNQRVGKKNMSMLEAASHLEVAILGSATLYQGRLTHSLPAFVGKVLAMKNDAENAIQFSRSAPGMTTSLIGMGQPEHVAANLKPAFLPPARLEDWKQLFATRER